MTRILNYVACLKKEDYLPLLESLAKQEPWSLKIGENTVSSLFGLFVSQVNYAKQHEPSMYPMLLNTALYVISLLSQKGVKDTQGVGERARSLGLEGLAEAILHPTKEWFEEIIQFDPSSLEQTKDLFEKARDSLEKGTTTVASLTQILRHALLYPSLDESKRLLKCASACQPFVFRSMDPTMICKKNASIFHFIVYTAYSFLKDEGQQAYFTFVSGISREKLIGWLVEEGVTDTMMGDEKISACTLASNLRLGGRTMPADLVGSLLKDVPVSGKGL